MNKSVGNKAIWGAIYTFVGDYFVYFINFLKGIILARILLPEMFGIMTLAEFFKGLFTQPINLGFDQAVIQKHDHLEKTYNGHFVLVNGAALLSFIITLVAFPFLSVKYGSEVAWVTLVLVLLMLTQTLSATPGVVLRKNFNFKKLSIIQVFSTLASFIVGVSLGLMGYGIWALVGVIAASGIVGLVLVWFWSPWRPTWKFDSKINKEILVFGGTIWVGGLFSFIMLQFDDFLVGQFAGLVVLGYYSKAYSLAQQPLGLFSQVANKIFGPVVAQIKDDREKLEKTINLVISVVFKGTVFVGMVLFIWAPQIITLLIGDKWLPMVPMFRGLIFYLTAQPIWEILGSYFTYTGQPKLYAKGQAIQALLLLTIGSFMVFKMGGIGAALIVSLIVGVTTVYYLIKHVSQNIKLDWSNNFLLPITAVIVTGMISSTILSLVTNIYLFWVALTVIPTLLYAIFLYLLQGKQLKEEIIFVYNIAKKNKK